MGDLHGILKGF